MESVGLSCQKLLLFMFGPKIGPKTTKTVAQILGHIFFGFYTYKLHVQHSRLLLTKKGPRNDTRSSTMNTKQIKQRFKLQLALPDDCVTHVT